MGQRQTEHEVPAPASHRLMDAALERMADGGVLAGLNLSEVAERAGVTPANIYHLFGTRQGLLRAAINRETARLAEPLQEYQARGLAGRRLAVFDWVMSHPNVRLGALLALDDDPDFAPLPFAENLAASYFPVAGELDGDVDVLAVHLLTLAASLGVAIYREAVARQLGESVDDLTARARAVFERMLGAIASDHAPHDDNTTGPASQHAETR